MAFVWDLVVGFCAKSSEIWLTPNVEAPGSENRFDRAFLALPPPFQSSMVFQPPPKKRLANGAQTAPPLFPWAKTLLKRPLEC